MTNKEAKERFEWELNNFNYTDNEFVEAMKVAIKALEERPKGEWIENSGNIACSHCHVIWLYRKTDFCPNCGASMIKGE